MQGVPPVYRFVNNRNIYRADQRQYGTCATCAFEAIKGLAQSNNAEVEKEQHQHGGNARIPNPPGSPGGLTPNGTGR